MRLMSRLFAIAAELQIGQVLKGSLDNYTVKTKLHRRIWIATTSTSQKVTVKTSETEKLQNECKVLEAFGHSPNIRPLIEMIDEPPALVLKHLDDNLLKASNAAKLPKKDIKLVARTVLQALDALHSRGYVHTDIKPDNILVNYTRGPDRFHEIQLGDCGDTVRVDPEADPMEVGPVIGSYLYRSPEAHLCLRWKAPTDIWSFGATLINLIWGQFHIFKPTDIPYGHKDYALHVFMKQLEIFGPPPVKYQDLLPDETLGRLAQIITYMTDKGMRRPFREVADEELSEEDKNLLLKVMKFDPRDRPTARELLQDEWLAGR